MYTVKEVADLLDVSQVTIYNHLKKNIKELKGLVTKKKGITYIKDEGLKVLKVSLGIIQVPTIKETISIEDIVEEISLSVREDIKLDYADLKEQIEVNNQALQSQIKSLEEKNDILIQLLQDKPSKTLLERFKGMFK